MEKYNGNNGHRKRLRNRFINSGIGAFEPHEIVEMFLHISIPRRDTKPIAKRLLKKFGSIEKTLSADNNLLTQVDGVGTRSAQLFELYREFEKSQKDFNYPSCECGFERYAAETVKNDKNLEFYFAVTDGCGHILYCRRIFDGGAQLLTEYFAEIAAAAMHRGGSEIYLFQHRPTPQTLKIYDEDIRAVSFISKRLEDVGLHFGDFIVICENRFCSYRAFVKT